MSLGSPFQMDNRYRGHSDNHRNHDDHLNHQSPNIIFLLADDLGYGDVHYNGGKAFTPNIDQMASGKHSVRFDRFYSSAPVCSPTRGSLLTGRNPNRFCIWRANTAGRDPSNHADFLSPAKYPLPHSEHTLAEILRNEGYITAVFGKWHLGDLTSNSGPLSSITSRMKKNSSSPGDNGFDIWKVTERAVPTSSPNCACFDSLQCRLGHYVKKGPPPCTNYHSASHSTLHTSQEEILKPHPYIIMKDDSEFLADEFSDFLHAMMASKKKQQPFFVYLPFHSVHNRYIASPPYNALYKGKEFQQKQLDYYASISALDAAVGRIRTLLNSFNISHNTMLWFSSDNGPAGRSPGRTAGLKGKKGTLYEGGIRVPGIIEWPAVITKNRISNHPVVTSDFVPTVLDSLGHNEALVNGRILDGISLLPLLRNKTARDSAGREIRSKASTIKWAFHIDGNFNNTYTAVLLENNLKLMATFERGKIIDHHLFDLDEFPIEHDDISSKHTALCSRLLKQLKKWTESVEASARYENVCLTESS